MNKIRALQLCHGRISDNKIITCQGIHTSQFSLSAQPEMWRGRTSGQMWVLAFWNCLLPGRLDVKHTGDGQKLSTAYPRILRVAYGKILWEQRDQVNGNQFWKQAGSGPRKRRRSCSNTWPRHLNSVIHKWRQLGTHSYLPSFSQDFFCS